MKRRTKGRSRWTSWRLFCNRRWLCIETALKYNNGGTSWKGTAEGSLETQIAKYLQIFFAKINSLYTISIDFSKLALASAIFDVVCSNFSSCPVPSSIILLCVEFWKPSAHVSPMVLSEYSGLLYWMPSFSFWFRIVISLLWKRNGAQTTRKPFLGCASGAGRKERTSSAFSTVNLLWQKIWGMNRNILRFWKNIRHCRHLWGKLTWVDWKLCFAFGEWIGPFTQNHMLSLY